MTQPTETITEVRKLRNALGVAFSALNAADKMCRYHGASFEHSGMWQGEPRCDSCKQPWRVNRALNAIVEVLP